MRSVDGVLVFGMVETPLPVVVGGLEALGLSVLEVAESPVASEKDRLAQFGDQILHELGGSWREPVLLSRPQLLTRLQHRRDEARQVFEEVSGRHTGAGGDLAPWVWSDWRLTFLAPFWIDVLGLNVGALLVHRAPGAVASRLAFAQGMSFADALVLWDVYNRAGLHLGNELNGVVLGIEAFDTNPAGAMERLSDYVATVASVPAHAPAPRSAALEMADRLDLESTELLPIPVPEKYLVLHRVLEKADSQPVDYAAVVEELAGFYDEEYYATYGNEGDAPYRPDEQQWLTFFATVADRICDDIAPKTVLDAGCALGFLVKALRERGVEAWGVDVSQWAIANVDPSVRSFCSVGSITEELEGHFDLITLIEVIEHLPEAVAVPVIANITRHAEAVLFSSTPDGFEEPTHINVQPPGYWARIFAANGFFRDFTYDGGYLSKDAILFRRGSPGVESLVEEYEQSVWSSSSRFQAILDQVVPERDHLVEAVTDIAGRNGELERTLSDREGRIEALSTDLVELAERRQVEAVAAEEELLLRDRNAQGLTEELIVARSAALTANADLEAIQATKIFRYTAGLRRLYGRVRRRGRAASPAGPPVAADPSEPRLSYPEWAARYDTLTDADRKEIRWAVNQISHPPVISVILPTYNTDERYLREAIGSVTKQLYPHWELCIADDASTDDGVQALIREFAKNEPRIKFVARQTNGHIAAASNSALELATGDWVVPLDHDDRLREHALALVALAAERRPEVGLIYSDEQIIGENSELLRGYFKADFDPLLLLSMNQICHLAAMRREIVERVGGFREGFEGSQDWDLLLRVTEHLEREDVHHIPHVLYDWRSHSRSTARSLAAKPYAADAGRRAVVEHLERTRVPAAVTSIPALGWNRVKWPLPAPVPTVSIIIPSRDGRWLGRCLQSLWSKTTYPDYEVIVVDNGSESAEFLEMLRQFDDRVTVIRDDRPFSYSGLNNVAVGRARGSILCLMNDDTEVLTPDWLDEMVGQLLQPHIGVVGAKLLYENGTIQHAGVILGVGGVGGHIHRHLDRLEIGYFGRAVCPQELSAVTGACMVVRRTAWDDVNGLDDEHLSVAYNDVDVCLRLSEKGWRTVWTPFAELIHHESLTRGHDREGENAVRLSREGRYMKSRWGSLLRADPHYNPNLTLVHEDASLASPPRMRWLDSVPSAATPG